jgi:hypothetical protein
MRKRRVQAQIPQPSNVQDFLNSYDPQQLVGALASFENSQGWELFKSYMFYRAASNAGAALALSQSTGRSCEAASEAGKAEALREAAESFLIELQAKIAGNEGIIEAEVPQE